MENNELKQMQIEEAKKRLGILVKQGLMQEVKDTFEKDGIAYYSCNGGILYWLTENNNCDHLVEVVKRFEEERNSLVYKAILSNTTIGEMLSLLYVSPHIEEWSQDKEELKEGLPLVWVENLSDPHCSEFGCIGIKTSMGGLVRIA